MNRKGKMGQGRTLQRGQERKGLKKIWTRQDRKGKTWTKQEQTGQTKERLEKYGTETNSADNAWL